MMVSTFLALTLTLTAGVLIGWALVVRRVARRCRVWRRLVRRADSLRRRRLLTRAPLRSKGAGLEAGPVVLQGVLRRRDGNPAWVLSGEDRLRRASPLVGRPLAPSGSELGEDLMVDLEDGVTVALAPPLRVMVGSEQKFASIALRFLHTGHPALAHGLLRAKERTRDYRTVATQDWTLGPLGDATQPAAAEEPAEKAGTDATLALAGACAL
jgi:hypothetical protein